METLSPNPQCMRTLIPLWVGDLLGSQSRTGYIKADSFYLISVYSLNSFLSFLKHRYFFYYTNILCGMQQRLVLFVVLGALREQRPGSAYIFIC